MLSKSLSRLWNKFQPQLFPNFGQEELSQTSDGHRRLILVVDNLAYFIYEILRALPESPRGRRRIDRFSFVIAFIAMRVLNITQTKALIDRLKVDPVLRRICLFPSRKNLPCEATFSNVFAEFAKFSFAEKLHEMLIKKELSKDLAHHVSRDSTAILAREKPTKKAKKEEEEGIKPSRKAGRPKKGEEVKNKKRKRLDQQLEMTLSEMLGDLPTKCDKGGKKDSKGNRMYWSGYKLHIDTLEGDVPVSAVITSASVHDSQVAIPLEEMTSNRLKSLYSLMDAAYDAEQIHSFVESKGKVAIIDHNPRRGEKIPFDPPKAHRYKARSSAERVNAYLKDNYGITGLRYRGASKLMTHFSFGLAAIATEQLLKFT